MLITFHTTLSMLCYAMLCYAALSDSMLYNALLCSDMLIMLCYIIPSCKPEAGVQHSAMSCYVIQRSVIKHKNIYSFSRSESYFLNNLLSYAEAENTTFSFSFTNCFCPYLKCVFMRSKHKSD